VPNKTKTDWVSSARETGGLDHLAVRAVSAHIYADLLPGITNLTDRIACYAFYPWFVWEFRNHSKTENPDEMIKLFRRAECLHTLIAMCHELETEENEWSHGEGLVGRQTLGEVARRILKGETIRLSRYATLDSANGTRYFKHRLGGLGQYYLGSLKELELLSGDVRQGLRYTEQWGTRLAEIYDQPVNGAAFFTAIRSGRIDGTVIKSLQHFCPCHLKENATLRDALIDLLFCRGIGEFSQQHGSERRNTLLLLLDHARAAESVEGHKSDTEGFLASTYSGALADGSPWHPHATLTACVRSWGVYYRHEMLGMATQGLFWAGLAALGRGGRVADIDSYAGWFAKRFQSTFSKTLAKESVFNTIESTRKKQPRLSDWRKPRHEVGLGKRIIEAQKEDEPDAVVHASIALLLSLAARDNDSGSGYADCGLPSGYLDSYEINLVSLKHHCSKTWCHLTIREWVEWLAITWGLRVHLRVALRKLRHQTEDTFRIVPRDDGLWVKEAPTPQWSSPRIVQALRALFDLGLLELDTEVEGKTYRLSSVGRSLLETELGSD